jgi:hypothetical protein
MMASEQAFDKPAANESEPIRDEDLEQSQAPQTQPPFLSEGPELVRDSHC